MPVTTPGPLDWVFRVVGLAPRGDSNDKYFTALALTVHGGMAVSYIMKPAFTPRAIPLHIVSIIGTVWVPLYNYFYPSNYQGLLEDQKEIDTELDLGEEDPAAPGVSWRGKASGVLMVCLVMSVSWYFYGSAWILVPSIYKCMTLCPIIQEMVLISGVSDRFALLNRRLMDHRVTFDTSESTVLLERLFKVHSCLHCLVSDIDLHYCLHNLLTFLARFVSCVLLMYDILMMLASPEERLDLGFVWRTILSVAPYVPLALRCHSCAEEANRTVLIAHRLLQPDTDDGLWDLVRQFSALTTDNKVRFTVGGVFTLDRTFLTKSFLTALSYLIIAVQLHDVQLFGGD